MLALEDEWGAHNYHPLPVVVARAEGPWVFDIDGGRYLDCLSAYSAVNQGHCHPRILQALRDQAERVTLTSRAYRNDQLPLFCRELAELCGMQMVLPMNTGAEAVETAIKAARKWAYDRKGVEPGPGRDPGLREQLPRPHHHDRGFLLRCRQPSGIRPVHAGIPVDSLR